MTGVAERIVLFRLQWEEIEWSSNAFLFYTQCGCATGGTKQKVCEPECTKELHLSVVYQGITKSNINNKNLQDLKGV